MVTQPLTVSASPLSAGASGQLAGEPMWSDFLRSF